jgi:hypothetical protein
MLWLLTPTDGRPEAFALLQRWIAAQDWLDGFRWLVGTRDAGPYGLRMNQIVVEQGETGGRHPLASNLLACLRMLDMKADDLAVIVEDDDYYAPGYLTQMAALSDGVSLCGQGFARYYNVRTRRFRQMGNRRHASLAQTAFKADVIPLLRSICERGVPRIDLPLWHEWRGSKRLGEPGGHVSIKGMPGAAGIGVGHRDRFGSADGGLVFTEWGIPSVYREFAAT